MISPHPPALDLGLLPSTPPWEHRTGRVGGLVERRPELFPQGNSRKCSPRVFFFFGKSSCLVLQLPLYKEGPVLSLSPPLLLDQDCPDHGLTWPNSQLSPAGAHSLNGFATSSLFPSLQLQATRSLTVLLKPCLAGEGAVNPALYQESCGRPGRCGPGVAVTLVPMLVPGTFSS